MTGAAAPNETIRSDDLDLAGADPGVGLEPVLELLDLGQECVDGYLVGQESSFEIVRRWSLHSFGPLVVSSSQAASDERSGSWCPGAAACRRRCKAKARRAKATIVLAVTAATRTWRAKFTTGAMTRGRAAPGTDPGSVDDGRGM